MNTIKELPQDVIDRFWTKVDIQSKDKCWEWQAGRDQQGYGIFCAKRTLYRAHRFSASFHHDIKNKVVCHACDNPSCVNPDHLWVGTQADNMQDMLAKGRHGWNKCN